MSSEERAPTMSSAVTVRDATREDMPLFLRLIQDLAAFEGMPEGPQLTVDDLIRDGFDTTQPWFFGMVAESDGKVVGYAICNRAFSSWTGRAYYIEDLYVLPPYRRAGIGVRMMRALCERAVAEGVGRIDWHVLKSNNSALAFYARMGARDMHVSEGRAALRLDEDRIVAVAAGDLLASPR
ncbi:thialysine N-epsilon-acetyltransferase [Manduca sexta]|uniref:N-acetyltransferase domain-containing protein n=1 Tax=Manduca sexta TaxID=7130 RepID=A0A921YQI1_MANSE|nr:thialysine N-epsilon-acetyltransferase [Manduca sexta]KAG6443956.1 hypothetical protein O3G_MSEX003050 [Manduca sexta]